MMQIADIERLVDIVKGAKISELVVTTGSPQRTIRLRKQIATASAGQAVIKSAPAEVGTAVLLSPSTESPATCEVFVTAQMVGIYHAANSAMQVGSNVRAGQVMGYIESMKLMNDVLSEFDGIITESLAEDGMPVEYGHKLFRLEQA